MKLTIKGGNFIETELLTRAIRAEFCVTEELDAKHQSSDQLYTRELTVDIYKEPNGRGKDITTIAERYRFLAAGWKRAAKKYRKG